MAVYSPWLTLVFLATAPLYALLMVMAAKLLRPIFLDLEDSFSKYHSYQIDAIKGIETVKALGGESAFRRLLLNQFLGVVGQDLQSRLHGDELRGRASRRSRFSASGCSSGPAPTR